MERSGLEIVLVRWDSITGCPSILGVLEEAAHLDLVGAVRRQVIEARRRELRRLGRAVAPEPDPSEPERETDS